MEETPKLPRIMQRLAEIGLAVVAVAAVVALVAVAIGEGGLDIPIQYRPDTDSYAITSDSWGSGTIIDSEGFARFESRDAGLAALFVTAVLVYSIPLAIVLFLLRRFLRAAADGHPFTKANALTMRWIGVVVIVFGLLAQGMRSIATVVAMNTLATEGIHIEAKLTPDVAVVFMGLVIVVIAEAFRYGTRLQADADLTI